VFAEDDWISRSAPASPQPLSGQASSRDTHVFEAGRPVRRAFGMRRTIIRVRWLAPSLPSSATTGGQLSPTEARFRTWLADLIFPQGKLEPIAAGKKRAAQLEEARHLFHRAWSRARDSPDYNKQHWRELDRALSELGFV
jgi:hypothetical protein